jgi:hypothetical protein
MRFKGNTIVLVVLILLFGQSFIHSQSFQSEIKSLSEGADVILTGKVIQQKSVWANNKSRIITRTTIQVGEYLKGNGANNSVVVNHPGGEVDGVGELYSHMPEFNNNEEVLVFLKKDKGTSDFKVFSGEDGKISLVTNSSGEKVTPSNIPLNSIRMQIKSYTNN